MSERYIVQTDPEGNRLFVVELHVDGERGLLVSYEGGGVFFWDGAQYLDEFVLMSKGFPVTVAETLPGVLMGMLGNSGTMCLIEEKREHDGEREN